MEKRKILEIIGKNLTNLLNETGLSPSALTKKCNVSAGSLSRIMKGNMSMTIPMAMEIAEGLGVDLSDLFEGLTLEKSDMRKIKIKELNKKDQISIGILSINNRKVTCVKNFKGKIIGKSELEGGLDLTETSGALLESIQASIFAACPKLNVEQSKLKTIKLILVTQSFEFEETRSKFRTFAERHFKEVILLADWQISYLSSFNNGHGISLIVDKGVSLSYKHHGGIKKLGGWKFPLYDLGGENWLGIQTIQHTIEAKEGYIPMSTLAQNVLAKFNGKIEKIAEICFKGSDPDVYCLFAELLLKSLMAGDPIAKAIVGKGFELIYRSVERANAILGKQTSIALSGSLAHIYKPYFKKDRLISAPDEGEKASMLADLTKDSLVEHGITW